MRARIIKKYFSIIFAVILGSTLCLGTVLLLLSSQYYIANKKTAMTESFSVIEQETNRKLRMGFLGDNELQRFYNQYSMVAKGDIFLADSEGRIVSSSVVGNKYSFGNVGKNSLQLFFEKPSYAFGNLDGLYDNDHHIIGEKINFGGENYYLFFCLPNYGQSEYVNEIMTVFNLAAVIVMAIVFVIIYAATVNSVDSLVNICDIAENYAKGDFSKSIVMKEDSRLAGLANCLNEMASSLSSMDTIRKSFVANVSHELRTPITSISGFVDGMLDGTIPQSEHKKYLTVVSQETKRLSRIISSMLSMAKFEAGEMKINCTTFNMIDMVVDCLFTFEKQIERKNLEIKGLDNGKIMVYADKDLIYQVVYNLIENAIKFVNENGYIEFSFYDKDGSQFFAIRNSGEGIGEDELPLVFDRFYKSDKSRSVDTTGVGLGLYICGSIIKMHNGNILVKSTKGEYTEFVFSIPKND